MFVQNMPVLGKWLKHSFTLQIVVCSSNFDDRITNDVKPRWSSTIAPTLQARVKDKQIPTSKIFQTLFRKRLGLRK